MPVVAHFVRRFLSSNTTFIRNQILCHKEFAPIVIYRDPVTPGFNIHEANPEIKVLDLSKNQTKGQLLQYRYLRKITPKQIKKTLVFLENSNAQIMHVHYGTDAGMFGEILKRSRLPSVVSFYGYDCSSFPKWYWGYGKKYLQNRVFKYATTILAMSDDMKRDLTALGCPENKIMVHYYGTDTKKFSDIKRDIKLLNNKIILLTAGRLDEKKGHIFMIQTLKKLIENGYTNFEWIIAGEGYMKKKILREIKSSALEDKIKLIGSYNYDKGELNDLFFQTDIYVQPSITASDKDKEGLPGTLIEAMAAGLPVISTYHAGIPSVITNNKTGILVKEWDIEGLMGAILSLSKNNFLRNALGKSGQEYAINTLDVQIKEIELEKIYFEILNSRINKN